MSDTATVGIGAAAERFNVTPSALRLWELQGLVTPTLTAGGHRRYTDAELKGLAYRLAQTALQRPNTKAATK